ncbi:DMT family transporter [Patescibacteria group bacterium]|nr:DMT family transporter [Patescibacteria group bacterium]
MTEERKGELFILSEALLWSLFPIIAVLSFGSLAPVTTLAWTTIFATLFFACVMFVKGTWRDLKNPLVWRYGLLIAFFIGIWFYGLYYLGLKYTTPGNASILVLFEVFTTYLLFNVLRKEAFSLEHTLGALFMIAGALIVLGENFTGFAVGDLLILGATFLAPFGNMFTQKCREIASSETIMFLRSLFSGFALLALAFFLKESIGVDGLLPTLPYLLINGVLIFGLSKLFWIEGIHRIPVTKAILLQSMSPFLTLLFAWLILLQVPTVWQISALIPFILGVILLTANFRVTRFTNLFEIK